ncbi:MAG: ABC transporter permease [Eggerthellaceae bacterium]|jgi:ABC-2 type transport system permease protein
MTIFKASLRIIWGHKIYLLIYLVLISLVGVLVGLSASSQEKPGEPSTTQPKVAVINRDNSTVSGGLEDFVLSQGTPVKIEDTKRALQDATATDYASYILIIPEGFGKDLMDAAQNNKDAPGLETIISYQSAAGQLMDVQVEEYLDAAYGYASSIASNEQEVVDYADSTMDQTADMRLAPTEAAQVATALKVYGEFSTYPLFASITIAIVLLMSVMNRRPIRERIYSSPYSSNRRNLELLCAYGIIGLIAWAWISSIGLFLFGTSMIFKAPLQVLIMMASLFVYALISVAIGFLLGQFALRENAANAIANIGGMVFSFLGGAWVPIEYMPESVVAFAHFVPSYWSVRAYDAAAGLSDYSAASLSSIGIDLGICLLFAVAIFAVAFALGKNKRAASV